MINEFSSSELLKCLDYLGTEVDSTLTSHIAETIMNKLDYSSHVTISQIKNFLPSLTDFTFASTPSLDDQSYDIIEELTNQKLPLGVLQWLQNIFTRQSFFPTNFTGLTQNEVLGKTLTAGSFLCHQHLSMTQNLVTPKLLSTLSHAVRNCGFNSIENMHVLQRIYDIPQNHLNPGLVRELGVFAYPLIVAPDKFGFSLFRNTELIIQSISLEALEIIQEMQLSEIGQHILRSLSREQSLFLMAYRSNHLTEDQKSILQDTLNRKDKHFENEDVLEVAKLTTTDISMNDVTSINRIKQNQSEVSERFIHIVYIYSSSKTVSASFLVTFITCFCISIFC